MANYIESIKVTGSSYPLRDGEAIHEDQIVDSVAESLGESEVVAVLRQQVTAIIDSTPAIMDIINSRILDKYYPVGSLYINVKDGTNPGAFIGGTWVPACEGRALVGFNSADEDFNSLEVNNGVKENTLSISNMPKHTHSITTDGAHTHAYSYANRSSFTESGSGNTHYQHNGWSSYSTGAAGSHTHTIGETGGNTPINNLMPYKVGYVWERIA